jgi:DtxR family transcriptional regulator, Mn-dependent transcriptional regulator
VAELHDATEHYLMTIAEIEEEGITPMRARLVERLHVSAPAVSEAIERLVDHGMVVLEPDRSLVLTKKGRDVANSTMRRHRLAERLLVDVIGLEWEKVHKEADRWEHAVSADVEEKLIKLLGDPATCPHGNPIPGSRAKIDRTGWRRLTDAEPGPLTVTRITEKLEANAEAISLVARTGLIPGRTTRLVGRVDGGVIVEAGDGQQVVPTPVASEIFVQPAVA